MNAKKRAQGTSIDANTITTSELAPRVSPDADIADQAQVRQSYTSEDEFIHINTLFEEEEAGGNDDNTLVTNNLAPQAALDTDAADQAILRQTTDLSEKKAYEAASKSTTAMPDTVSILQAIGTPFRRLRRSEGEKHETHFLLCFPMGIAPGI